MHSLNQLPIDAITIYNRLCITEQNYNWQRTGADNNMTDGQQFWVIKDFHFPIRDNIIPKNRPIHRRSKQTPQIIRNKNRCNLLVVVFHLIIEIKLKPINNPPNNHMSIDIASNQKVIVDI
jgi:hypothetical protein